MRATLGDGAGGSAQAHWDTARGGVWEKGPGVGAVFAGGGWGAAICKAVNRGKENMSTNESSIIVAPGEAALRNENAMLRARVQALIDAEQLAQALAERLGLENRLLRERVTALEDSLEAKRNPVVVNELPHNATLCY